MMGNKIIQNFDITAAVDAGRKFLTTAEAAYVLNRKPQTLQVWACYGKGPVLPIRLGKKNLGWPIKDIQELMQAG